jgi:hypothetical protein
MQLTLPDNFVSRVVVSNANFKAQRNAPSVLNIKAMKKNHRKPTVLTISNVVIGKRVILTKHEHQSALKIVKFIKSY